jgi:hypothetical protein
VGIDIGSIILAVSSLIGAQKAFGNSQGTFEELQWERLVEGLDIVADAVDIGRCVNALV